MKIPKRAPPITEEYREMIRKLHEYAEKNLCPKCKLYKPYDREDPDASICIHYDCSAPEFKHFEEKLKDGEKDGYT